MPRRRTTSLPAAIVAVVLAVVLALVLAVAGCTAARPSTAPGGSSPASTSPPGSPTRWQGSPGAASPSSKHLDPLAAQLYREMFQHRRNPCGHNTARKFVRVSVHRQHMWLCARRHVVRSIPVTTGVVGQYTSTPTGRFRIQELDRNTTLTLITGQQYVVKYWIPFEGPLFGFHDAPWQTFPFGSPKYRRQGSHGCVHMPLHAIAFLYRWARVGTPVRIAA